MFSNSKVEVLESKLDMYEDLSREMLAKLENAVEKISEGNNRIAQILTKHDERIEQSMKTDSLIIKMIDELKEESEKDHKVIHRWSVGCSSTHHWSWQQNCSDSLDPTTTTGYNRTTEVVSSS
jgi:hypothetical protein